MSLRKWLALTAPSTANAVPVPASSLTAVELALIGAILYRSCYCSGNGAGPAGSMGPAMGARHCKSR
jgi:hypothetical protein